MALIKCPECGKEISDKAEHCPRCGYPISPVKQSPPVHHVNGNITNKKNIYGAIVVAVVLGITILVNENTNKREYLRTSSYSNGSYSSYSSKPKTGNAGALANAESYLNSSAFSYDGLIDQLEYSGFSSSEAKYAADNCGANWKEQALKKAKSYLNSSAFSYNGLIEQLEFTGFTADESKYAADNCGANWKEQASKKAASYLRSSEYTRYRLIDQLEFSGFTHEEAVYGADQNIK